MGRLMTRFLHPETTHLDYGCGYGMDVELLQKMGFNSRGYDPHYFPDPPSPAEVVTCNYVINVIHDPTERREALLNAWALAGNALILATELRRRGERRVNDPGQVSRRNVWSRTYTILEFRAYVETTLGVKTQTIGTDKLIAWKNAPAVTVRTREQVLEYQAELESQGWIMPLGTSITPKYAKNRQFYRLCSSDYNLPGKTGPVKIMYLGERTSDKFAWALAALIRRNLLTQAKFHCSDLSFLHEFYQWRDHDVFTNELSGVTF